MKPREALQLTMFNEPYNVSKDIPNDITNEVNNMIVEQIK